MLYVVTHFYCMQLTRTKIKLTTDQKILCQFLFFNYIELLLLLTKIYENIALVVHVRLAVSLH